MKCDLCNKPAVVHEMQITDGVKQEIHLCQEHAAQQGFADIHAMSMQHFPTKVGSAAVQSPACPSCGTTSAQIRQTTQMGCADCYEAFAGLVKSLIEQSQHGGMHHVGRRPAGSDGDIAKRHETQRLLRELEAAVAAEQYERAGEIRDELARGSRSAPMSEEQTPMSEASGPSEDPET
jgi:protein arginine kinase activator